MKDIDNLNRFPSYSVHNAVGDFNEFTNTRPSITVDNAAEAGKRRQLIAALQNTIDRTVRGFLRFSKNAAMDVGERS
jgi:hypothetical protein